MGGFFATLTDERAIKTSTILKQNRQEAIYSNRATDCKDSIDFHFPISRS